MPWRTDPHLLGQEEAALDPALFDRRPQGRLPRGHIAGRELLAAGSLGTPGDCRLAEAGRAPVVAGEVQAAALAQFVVDAGLGAEFLGPCPVQPIGIGRQPFVRRCGGKVWCRRKNTGCCPGGGVAGGIAGEHADRKSAVGEFTGDRQADDASADDAAVCHAGGSSSFSLRLSSGFSSRFRSGFRSGFRCMARQPRQALVAMSGVSAMFTQTCTWGAPRKCQINEGPSSRQQSQTPSLPRSPCR